MILLDKEALIIGINGEMECNKKEIDSAVRKGGYEQAARLHLLNHGLILVRSMIQMGDFDKKVSDYS